MRMRSGFMELCAPATPAPSPHPPSPGCVHLRGQKLPRVNNSLQQFATSFELRLCNPITEQISLVEHQKRKREGRKKTQACTGEVFGEKWGRSPLPEGRGEAGNLKQDWSLDSLHRLPSVNKCPQSTEGEAVADMLTFRDNSW